MTRKLLLAIAGTAVVAAAVGAQTQRLVYLGATLFPLAGEYDTPVIRFRDPSNGATCYAIPPQYRGGAAISCVIPREVRP